MDQIAAHPASKAGGYSKLVIRGNTSILVHMNTGRIWRPAFLALTAGLIGGCRPATQSSAPPAEVVSAVNRGVSLMGQYQYDGAVTAFEEAVKAAPDLATPKINLAIALFNRGKRENDDLGRAGELLQEVLRKDTNNVRALYFQGIINTHIGKAELAIPFFERVLQQRPNDGAVWYLLGLCKQRLGQSAETELLRAVELRPHLFSAWYKLGQAALAAGNEAKGNEYLEKFKQLRESPLGESIELPQYGQMGELALVAPIGSQSPPPRASSIYSAGSPRQIVTQRSATSQPTDAASGRAEFFGGAACGDVNGDGQPDLFLVGWPGGQANTPFALKGNAGGVPFPAPTNWGLDAVEQPLSCAVGDFDNDAAPDLFVVCAGTNHLFHGSTNGSFTEVTRTAGITASGGRTRSALWLDEDHDGDLDLFVCNEGAPNQLFRNNGDGTFTDIATSAGVALPDGTSVMVLSGDLDGDRDMDLVILRSGAPARILLNDLLGKFHETNQDGLEIRGDLGGVLQDFDGDGLLDLVVLGGDPAELKLFLGDGHGRFKPSDAFADSAKAATALGPLRGLRAADLDLDGDLDIAFFGEKGHVLINDGHGRFDLQTHVWSAAAGAVLAGAELCDLTGDLVPDLLLFESGEASRASLVPGKLSPPSTAVSLEPSGIRSRDGRTRSPASGYGVTLTARAGLHEPKLIYTGLNGGPNQSALPAVLGLAGATEADYVHLLWPDGVAQVETNLAAGQIHKISELQRKVSSCPVLFAWNGERFEFVTDFAGVGGLGYFVAPGVSAPPQVEERMKIEPAQLRAKDGFYELRVTEPMEETAYIDRLELLAVDHPADISVFPEEHLAISGPAPTHELLVVEHPVFPVKARALEGADSSLVEDCADNILRVDRIYAYHPPLDRRYIGFCQPHTLELDFGDRLAALRPSDRVFLFIDGCIEYPYSQTVYAASQSRVRWEPIRVDQQQVDGSWKTIVPDGGAPGGMARMMTIDLTGKLDRNARKLRLTSNLEILYDQVFVASDCGRDKVRVRAVPMTEADLRRVGFAKEFSPDGREPLIYDYHQSEPTAPFHVLHGAYTRFGPVKELLTEFDDRFVLVGPGEEIALKFDATEVPPVPAGVTRSFVLVSHAYCKDMDLYTATPQTVEPLPFRAMSRYPYPPDEHFPDTPELQRWRGRYNTRIME